MRKARIAEDREPTQLSKAEKEIINAKSECQGGIPTGQDSLG